MEKLKEPKAPSKEYTQFLIDLEEASSHEEKLKKCLAFLKESLSKEGTPSFRDFWEAKKLCLELFKEKLPPRTRAILWTEYSEISDEIRSVKKVLDEQSSFAHEQITLALDALEGEIAGGDTLFDMDGGVEIPKSSKLLSKNGALYSGLSKELRQLVAFTGRLQALRKELVQTSMKAKAKNQLFARMSKIGDELFPLKKKRVGELSELFEGDVKRFVEEEFSLNRPPYFGLKEEIKHLQGLAKELPIQSSTFQSCRTALSQCWQQIREKEKAYGKEKSEERKRLKENLEPFQPKVEAFEGAVKRGELSLKEADAAVDAFFKEMREAELSKEDAAALRKRILTAKSPLEEAEARLIEAERVAEQKQQEREKEAIANLLEELAKWIDQAENQSLESLVEKWEAFVKEKESYSPKKEVGDLLNHRLSVLGDFIQEKRWQHLKSESGESLSIELHQLLDERTREKRKVKESLEEHRKEVAKSGVGFEESMLLQELISDEKLRLDSIETMIEEMEEALFDLEG